MNNIIKRKWNKNAMVNIEDLRGMAFQAESGGHTFQISGIDGDGNPVALSGTPAGVMIRSDNQDVALTCSISNGKVNATLPANAYSVPGRFGITIFLTSDGQKTAIYAAAGTVGKTSSGTVAPPAGSDVVDLVNAIAAAVATIPASYTDLMAAMAPTYSSSGLYAVGSYAWYNGKLYRCTTPITSGETWTSGHWTLANLGSDLVDLKSAVNSMRNLPKVTWTLGKIINDAGSISSNPVRAITDIIPCHAGDVFVDHVPNKDNNNVYLLAYICTYKTVSTENDTFVERIQITTNNTYTMGDEITGFRYSFGRSSASGVAVTQNDIDTYFSVDYFTNTISEVDLNKEIGKNIGKQLHVMFMTTNGVDGFYYENDSTNSKAYIKATGEWRIRGDLTVSINYSNVLTSAKTTSPNGVEDCIELVYTEYCICYDVFSEGFVLAQRYAIDKLNMIPVFMFGVYEKSGIYGIVGGIGQWMYQEYMNKNVIDAAFTSNYPDRFYFEYDTDIYIKMDATWYFRGYETKNTAYADIIPDNRYTSPAGVTDCIKITTNQSVCFDTQNDVYVVVYTNKINDKYLKPIFVPGMYSGHNDYGIVGGLGQWMYQETTKQEYVNQSLTNYRYDTIAFSNEAKTLVNKVLADRDINTISVAVITDCHNKPSKSPLNQIDIFNRIAEKCADFSITLGDLINGFESTLVNNMRYYTEMWERHKDTFLPIMFTRGNHEMYGNQMRTDTSTYMTGDPTAMTLSQVFGIASRPRELNPVYSATKGNWYFDMNGIRFIGLDSAYKNNGGFNQEGIDFLENALNTDLKIVVFAHFPANQNVNWRNRSINNGSTVETMLRTSDNVIAYIHGHTHWDNIAVVSGNSYPYIATCCGLAEKGDIENDGCSLGNPTNYTRTIGTYSEYCFDIYNIHKDTGKIKIFRFGAGNDREYPVPEE